VPYFLVNHLNYAQFSSPNMTDRKSSKKDEQILGSLDVSGVSRDKQQLKSTLPKNRSPRRRTRVVHRRTPNVDAATEVVAQSVVARIGERENSKPQAKVADSKILAGRVKKEARSRTTPQRKKETTDTKNLQTRGVTKKSSKKRSTKSIQSSARQAEAQPTKKSTVRKNQRQSRTSKVISDPTLAKPESTQADTTPKKSTSKTRKRTPQKKSETKPKDRVEKATAQTKTSPRVKRKPRKTRAKTVAPSVVRHPVDMTTDDYVIGFQGIYYKPYQLTNSDLFMSGAQQDHFMDILTRAKEKLLSEEADRASQLQENDASNLPDPLDQGTNEGVFHNQLRTRDRESQLVRKINRAIDCLKTGSYGYCEACGCEIPIRRLEARPIVTKCIDCKERDELRERQLGQ